MKYKKGDNELRTKLTSILRILDCDGPVRQCREIADILEDRYAGGGERTHWWHVCALLRVDWPDAMKIVYELAFVFRDRLYSTREGRTAWYIACRIVEQYQFRREVADPEEFIGMNIGVLAEREVSILRQQAVVWVVVGLVAGIVNYELRI